MKIERERERGELISYSMLHERRFYHCSCSSRQDCTDTDLTLDTDHCHNGHL